MFGLSRFNCIIFRWSPVGDARDIFREKYQPYQRCLDIWCVYGKSGWGGGGGLITHIRNPAPACSQNTMRDAENIYYASIFIITTPSRRQCVFALAFRLTCALMVRLARGECICEYVSFCAALSGAWWRNGHLLRIYMWMFGRACLYGWDVYCYVFGGTIATRPQRELFFFSLSIMFGGGFFLVDDSWLCVCLLVMITQTI